MAFHLKVLSDNSSFLTFPSTASSVLHPPDAPPSAPRLDMRTSSTTTTTATSTRSGLLRGLRPLQLLITLSLILTILSILALPGAGSSSAYPAQQQEEQEEHDVEAPAPAAACTSEFVPTEEFRTVQPWECLPKGLHVRINFSTGQKEAKLIAPSTPEDEAAYGVVVIPPLEASENVEQPEDSSETEEDVKFSYVRQGEDEERGGIPAELRDEILASIMGQGSIKPEANHQALKNGSDASSESHASTFKVSYTIYGSNSEEIVEGLTALEDVVGDYADGVDFLRLKADDSNHIVNDLLSHSDVLVRIHSARVLSACFSNNPDARKIALTRGYLHTILHHLDEEPDVQAQSSLIFTIGTLLRGDVQLLNEFHQPSPKSSSNSRRKPIRSTYKNSNKTEPAKSRSAKKSQTGMDVISAVFSQALEKDDNKALMRHRKVLRTRVLRLVNDLLDDSILPDTASTDAPKKFALIRALTSKAVVKHSAPFCAYLSGMEGRILIANRDAEEDFDAEVEAAGALRGVVGKRYDLETKVLLFHLSQVPVHRHPLGVVYTSWPSLLHESQLPSASGLYDPSSDTFTGPCKPFSLTETLSTSPRNSNTWAKVLQNHCIAMLSIIIAILLSVLAVPASLLIYFHVTTRKPRINLPFPKPSPIVGNVPEILANVHRYNEMFHDHARMYGRSWALLYPTFNQTQYVMTVDPAIVEHVLKTNFDNYIKGPFFYEALKPMLGDGIFNVDGEHWRWQRKVSSHIFTTRNFRASLRLFPGLIPGKVITEEIHIMIDQLKATSETKENIDLYELLHSFTMDTFGKIAFGSNLNTLTSSPSPFVQAFNKANSILAFRFADPVYPITEWFTGARSELDRCVTVINRFAEDRIREKREALAGGGGDSDKGYKDLLDLYLEVKIEGESLTDKQLRDMVLNMMIAERKDIVEKIRQEVEMVTNGQIPSYDEVASLKYANAVFLEVLRLYPSVPTDLKTAVNDDVLPGGIFIPKGTDVNWLPYVMGRMEFIWGPDACDFKPERWIDVSGNVKRESPFKFTAFNAGPRTCLGQQMAMVEGVMALVALVSSFEFNLSPDANVAQGLGLTLGMQHGLKMQNSDNLSMSSNPFAEDPNPFIDGAQGDGDPWSDAASSRAPSRPRTPAPPLPSPSKYTSESSRGATFQIDDSVAPAKSSREAELERKEQELKAREAKLAEREKTVGTFKPPNFPPFRPLVYHDIQNDIPEQARWLVKRLFMAWWLSTATYVMNFAAAFALLIVKAESSGGTFGLALIIMLIGIPVSFVFWYQPLYFNFLTTKPAGVKTDRSISFFLFFFNFSFHLAVSALLAVGIPGWGGAGVIYCLSQLGSQLAVGVLCAISSSLFIFEVVYGLWQIKAVQGYYRSKGLTMEQAKQQAIEGVASSSVGREVAGAAIRSAYAADTRK
ncbi:Protein kinase alk2 [Dinochytrium kinnereticum]|nr:Protein kinase alk2 [Dinochytrium kinnereticum]